MREELHQQVLVGAAGLQFDRESLELGILEPVHTAGHRIGFEVERCFRHIDAVPAAGNGIGLNETGHQHLGLDRLAAVHDHTQ